MTTANPVPSSEVATVAKFTVDQLHNIKTFSDALNSAPFEDAAEYGTGFDVLDTKDKDKLVGVGFVILDYKFSEGDQGEFVSLTVVTEDNKKYIVNDGSTGICAQMQSIVARRVKLGIDPSMSLGVKKGLRRSDYIKTVDGKDTAATTFYLSI